MSDKAKDPAELRERLWKEIDKARFGMLGLVGGEPHHLQPMTCFTDEASGAVWFFTNRDSDLAREASGGAAMLCIMAKDQEFQACLHGSLSLSHDPAKIDQYWSPFVAAWFPQGKDDPGLTLLRLDLVDARVWASHRGPFSYPFEVVKANLTGSVPDVGVTADLAMR